jgi:hypothetical protein
MGAISQYADASRTKHEDACSCSKAVYAQLHQITAASGGEEAVSDGEEAASDGEEAEE